MDETPTIEEGRPTLVGERPPQGPVVVEVRGLTKSFRVPEHRVESFKERASHPFTRMVYRDLPALRDVSFDVRRGEFFGIVGRNGSGKSTLLKVLASIYRADAGRARIAGRLAPFIELGVGFDPELSARENSVLNGVLMGLSKREARSRLDAVLAFAELEEFEELKLKNYSSGMMVRLAFAVMVQADADVMLIDEVLAVGDAAFAQKCMDVFQERRRAGKTIILVTHDMQTVQSLCDRALLLHDGEVQTEGDPEATALEYYRLNFGVDTGEHADIRGPTVPELGLASVVRAELVDDAGKPADNLEQGVPLRVDAVIEARRELASPRFVFHVLDADGTVVFSLDKELAQGSVDRLAANERVHFTGSIDNHLVPGRYYLNCWVRRDTDEGSWAVQALQLLEFVVFGTAPRHGLMLVGDDLEGTPERGREGFE